VNPGTSAEAFKTTIAPWLTVSDAQKAVDFYTAAFAAVEIYRLEGDDGKIAVAQLAVDGAAFWVQEEESSRAPGSTSVRMILSVEDPDAAHARAVAVGATEVAPVSEEYGWRTGRVTDPFGYDWELSRQLGE
jgi:PhnB protein